MKVDIEEGEAFIVPDVLDGATIKSIALCETATSKTVILEFDPLCPVCHQSVAAHAEGCAMTKPCQETCG